MESTKFQDRFDETSFQREEPVRVAVSKNEPTPENDVWIPESIAIRLVFIGKAYQLHLIPLLDQGEDRTFNCMQCQGLNDELAFIANTVQDPLLHKHIAKIEQLSRFCVDSGSELYFEWS